MLFYYSDSSMPPNHSAQFSIQSPRRTVVEDFQLHSILFSFLLWIIRRFLLFLVPMMVSATPAAMAVRIPTWSQQTSTLPPLAKTSAAQAENGWDVSI